MLREMWLKEGLSWEAPQSDVAGPERCSQQGFELKLLVR